MAGFRLGLDHRAPFFVRAVRARRAGRVLGLRLAVRDGLRDRAADAQSPHRIRGQGDPARAPVAHGGRRRDRGPAQLGRLDFGVGLGYRKYEFEGLGVPIEEKNARFKEALRSSSAHGPRRVFVLGPLLTDPEAVAGARPCQQPHPPVWIASGSAPRRYRLTVKNRLPAPVRVGPARTSCAPRTTCSPPPWRKKGGPGMSRSTYLPAPCLRRRERRGGAAGRQGKATSSTT